MESEGLPSQQRINVWPGALATKSEVKHPAASGGSATPLLSAGIIFDSTYSGKAFHALREDIKADPGYWKGRKVSHRMSSH